MLGERLVMIRKNYKYSQLEFSQVINIKRPVLSMYENNLRLPSLPLILGLDTKFPEINLHWLLSGEGNMFENSQKEELKKKTGSNAGQYKPTPSPHLAKFFRKYVVQH